MCVVCCGVLWCECVCVCKSQRTACGNLFFPSTTWASSVELKVNNGRVLIGVKTFGRKKGSNLLVTTLWGRTLGSTEKSLFMSSPSLQFSFSFHPASFFLLTVLLLELSFGQIQQHRGCWCHSNRSYTQRNKFRIWSTREESGQISVRKDITPLPQREEIVLFSKIVKNPIASSSMDYTRHQRNCSSWGKTGRRKRFNILCLLVCLFLILPTSCLSLTCLLVFLWKSKVGVITINAPVLHEKQLQPQGNNYKQIQVNYTRHSRLPQLRHSSILLAGFFFIVNRFSRSLSGELMRRVFQKDSDLKVYSPVNHFLSLYRTPLYGMDVEEWDFTFQKFEGWMIGEEKILFISGRMWRMIVGPCDAVVTGLLLREDSVSRTQLHAERSNTTRSEMAI